MQEMLRNFQDGKIGLRNLIFENEPWSIRIKLKQLEELLKEMMDEL